MFQRPPATTDMQQPEKRERREGGMEGRMRTLMENKEVFANKEKTKEFKSR